MELQQVIFLLILGGGLVLFVTERFRVDVTALLILVALALTGILTAEIAVGEPQASMMLRTGIGVLAMLSMMRGGA